MNNNFGKFILKMGLLSLLSVMPLAAQVDNYGVVFTAPFPFYAGNVELPAGSYKLTQTNVRSVVQLRNSASDDGVFLNSVPASSVRPSRETDVTFHKIGGIGYLRAVSVAGETDGIEFSRSKAEKKAAATETVAEKTDVVEHATLVSGE